eukprot:gene4980-21324_t
MPRIKAILTGAIPQFIDVVMNFASVELKQDNIVAKFYKKRKNIIFFGDDTWIKLLPKCFLRQEGTTSFVVSDFTEVDDNVTRHLNEELSRFDWDVMILHFLGLDHIGHTFGPYHSLIGPKLLEMDQVIEKIVESLAQRNRRYSEKSLFVLTSDHGMNDAGGHGGSTTAETITPLVFASSHSLKGQGKPFTRKMVNQIDIAATISSFFDLAIPVQSVGALIGDLLKFHPIEVQKQKVKENICQLAEQTGHITFNSATAGSILQCCNRRTECLKNTSLVDLNRLLQEQSALLQAQFSGYHPEKMFFGIALLFFSFVLSWWQWFIPILSSFPKHFRSGLNYWLLFAIAVHSLSMASTSYIEEEHQLWYFLLTTSMLILLFSGTANINKGHTTVREGFQCVYFLLLLRIMRGWNQTGVKWLGQKDIAHLLRANESKLNILIIIFISLMSIYYVYFCSARTLGNVLNAVGLILVLFNKSIGLLQWQHLFVNEKTAARLVFAVSFFIGIRPMAQLAFMKVAGRRQKEYVESPQERKGVLDQRVKYILRNSLDWLRLQIDLRAWLQSKLTSKQDLTEGECYRAEQGHLHALLLIYLLVLRPHNLVWMGIVAAVETTLSTIVKNRFDANYDVPFIMTNFVFARACFHAQGLSNALSSIDVSTGLTGFNHYSPVFACLLVSIATYGIHIFWVNALACHIAPR